MKEHPEVDVYVPVEGEVGFSNLIGKILEKNNKDEFFENPIDGCIIRNKQGNFYQ